MASEIRWLPMESNPDVMNKFLVNLGVSKEISFVDILGFEEELLLMVPRPALAVLLLFPVKDSNEKLAEAPACCTGDEWKEDKVYFMMQTIRNACGTMALVHAVANNQSEIPFTADSRLKHFLEQTKSLEPIERSKLLEGSQEISSAHESSSREGQTSAPDVSQAVDFHFVAFVRGNGRIYELDGRREQPICHGTTSKDTFLEDAAVICRKFMDKNPGNLNFTAVALVKEGP